MTRADVFTALACPHTPSCRVPDTNIDFSPLMDFENNFRISGEMDGGSTYLSVCKTLVTQSELRGCPENSAVCRTSKGSFKNTVPNSILFLLSVSPKELLAILR